MQTDTIHVRAGGTEEGYCSEQCPSIGLSWQGDFFAPALQDPAEQPHDNGGTAEGQHHVTHALRKRPLDPVGSPEDAAVTPFRRSVCQACGVAQAKQAGPMAAAVARRFGPAPEVGDTVQVAVPGVDRGKVDATTCTLVIIEVSSRLYEFCLCWPHITPAVGIFVRRCL